MASNRSASQVLKEKLICKLCGNGPIVGKSHWYQCYNQHPICQDCFEVAQKEHCFCGKSILKEHCALTEELLKLESMQLQISNMSVNDYNPKSFDLSPKNARYFVVKTPCQKRITTFRNGQNLVSQWVTHRMNRYLGVTSWPYRVGSWVGPLGPGGPLSDFG